MKVLIADDDSITRTIVSEAVADWGFDVVEAADGDEARAELDRHPGIRLAILDWEMPGRTGVAICRDLLDRETGEGVYTILLTARDREEDLLFALQCGANSFLAKPVSMPLLRAHLGVGRRLAEAESRLARYATRMETLAEERARRLVEAEKLARTDALTGALNRRGFLEVVEKEFRRARRYRRPLTVLGVDADHFKKVNDRHGHSAGDEVLRALVRTITSGVREGDVVGRIGGEEFSVALPETGMREAEDVADRLRRAIEETQAVVDGRAIRVTVSVGVAALADADDSLSEILVRADEALFDAKRRGRNRVCSRPASRTATRFGVVGDAAASRGAARVVELATAADTGA